MIYTGYYSKIKEYADSGLTLLSISRTKPEFAKSCIDIPQLFPSDKILWDHKKGKIDEMEYTSKYLDQLNELGVDRIIKMIQIFGDNVVLLCWESPEKFCHRHILADYINKNSGVVVEEFGKEKEISLFFFFIIKSVYLHLHFGLQYSLLY